MDEIDGEAFTEEEVQEIITWIESLNISQLAELKRYWDRVNKPELVYLN